MAGNKYFFFTNILSPNMIFPQRSKSNTNKFQNKLRQPTKKLSFVNTPTNILTNNNPLHNKLNISISPQNFASNSKNFYSIIQKQRHRSNENSSSNKKFSSYLFHSNYQISVNQQNPINKYFDRKYFFPSNQKLRSLNMLNSSFNEKSLNKESKIDNLSIHQSQSLENNLDGCNFKNLFVRNQLSKKSVDDKINLFRSFKQRINLTQIKKSFFFHANENSIKNKISGNHKKLNNIIQYWKKIPKRILAKSSNHINVYEDSNEKDKSFHLMIKKINFNPSYNRTYLNTIADIKRYAFVNKMNQGINTIEVNVPKLYKSPKFKIVVKKVPNINR